MFFLCVYIRLVSRGLDIKRGWDAIERSNPVTLLYLFSDAINFDYQLYMLLLLVAV